MTSSNFETNSSGTNLLKDSKSSDVLIRNIPLAIRFLKIRRSCSDFSNLSFRILMASFFWFFGCTCKKFEDLKKNMYVVFSEYMNFKNDEDMGEAKARLKRISNENNLQGLSKESEQQ